MREKACGLDVHKKFILAAVIDQDGTTAEQRFSRTQTDLFLLKDWVSYHGCEVVACESTSDYWVQVYDLPPYFHANTCAGRGTPPLGPLPPRGAILVHRFQINNVITSMTPHLEYALCLRP